MLARTLLEVPTCKESCFVTMEAWLGSLLFLATMVIASKAVCSIENREIFPNQMSDDCMDADGNKHFLNTPWKKNCTWCSCDKTSITCCTNSTRPLSYDKDNCDVQFHPENCTYSVVDRKNPGKTCRVDSWTM